MCKMCFLCSAALNCVMKKIRFLESSLSLQVNMRKLRILEKQAGKILRTETNLGTDRILIQAE